MTEVVLPYDKSIVGQETGYWCGPAATQVVLNSNGIKIQESQLAREIGTTTRGTDYIGLIGRILDRYSPEVNYTSVYTERDPMTAIQKETLWRHLTQSINAGRGVVMNWVVPYSNRPRGVKGSTSPNYRSIETYHYVSAMGYSDEGGRFVWIADSGFQPPVYWITFDQCATLIPPKGYAYADTGIAVPPTPIQTPPVALLSKAMGDTVGLDVYAKILPFYAKALLAMNCTTQKRIAMVTAQFRHESVGFKFMRELWGPTKDQLNYDNMMGNGPGEGRKYLGRGPIQVTGKNNYRELSKWAFNNGIVSSPTYFIDKPDELEKYEYAFLGAVWYITTQQPKFIDFADAGNIEDASKAINAPAWIGKPLRANGIEQRIKYYKECMTMDLTPLLLQKDDDDMDPGIAQMIRDLHEERFEPIASTSKYATEGEGAKWNRAQLERNKDAMLHEADVERHALMGDAKAIKLVVRQALLKDNDSESVLLNIDDHYLTADQTNLKRAIATNREVQPNA